MATRSDPLLCTPRYFKSKVVPVLEALHTKYAKEIQDLDSQGWYLDLSPSEVKSMTSGESIVPTIGLRKQRAFMDNSISGQFGIDPQSKTPQDIEAALQTMLARAPSLTASWNALNAIKDQRNDLYPAMMVDSKGMRFGSPPSDIYGLERARAIEDAKRINNKPIEDRLYALAKEQQLCSKEGFLDYVGQCEFVATPRDMDSYALHVPGTNPDNLHDIRVDVNMQAPNQLMGGQLLVAGNFDSSYPGTNGKPLHVYQKYPFPEGCSQFAAKVAIESGMNPAKFVREPEAWKEHLQAQNINIEMLDNFRDMGMEPKDVIEAAKHANLECVDYTQMLDDSDTQQRDKPFDHSMGYTA